MTEPAATVDESSPAAPAAPPPHDRFDVFLDAIGRTFGLGFGLGMAAVVVLVAVAVISSGKLGDIFDEDQFHDRVDSINAVYRQGERVRAELSRSGTALTNETMCEDAFHRVGADDERVNRWTKDQKPDTAFAELRKLSFINGCLGRPNQLPATPLPTPSPTR
ncbi:hypothetical protein [Micromonospora maritima]|uniref:hypothetical protein n=1 Tax=Micromonospora maritima TaxID=986711 RepID=UPI00157DC2E0|nr:hypothetical protein [Micromonospora maritima]